MGFIQIQALLLAVTLSATFVRAGEPPARQALITRATGITTGEGGVDPAWEDCVRTYVPLARLAQDLQEAALFGTGAQNLTIGSAALLCKLDPEIAQAAVYDLIYEDARKEFGEKFSNWLFPGLEHLGAPACNAQ